MSYNATALRAELRRDEGERLKPYFDTVDKITIGVGRNLSDRGITKAQSAEWLDEDIELTEALLNRNIPWWSTLSDARQRVLMNMCFNMGWCSADKKHGLCTFVNTLEFIRTGHYAEAAAAMLKSKWAKQVGQRAIRLAEMMKNG